MDAPPQHSHKKQPLKETRRARVFAITNDDDDNEEDARWPTVWEGHDDMAFTPPPLTLGTVIMWPCNHVTLPLGLLAEWQSPHLPPPPMQLEKGERPHVHCASVFLYFSFSGLFIPYYTLPCLSFFVPGIFFSWVCSSKAHFRPPSQSIWSTFSQWICCLFIVCCELIHCTGSWKSAIKFKRCL